MQALQLGGIYQFGTSEFPVRIIALDEIEVFYDSASSIDGSWMFSGKQKGKLVFYRTSRLVFEKEAKYIDIQKFTEEEFLHFRPDLPLRMLRLPSISWSQLSYSGKEAYYQFYHDHCSQAFKGQRFAAKELYLAPLTKKESIGKASCVQSSKEDFSADELLWKAQGLQNSLFSNTKHGIGLYRLGSEKGIPSYYIGTYYDLAGTIAYWEKANERPA